MNRGQRLFNLFSLSRKARNWFIAAMLLPLLLLIFLLVLLALMSATPTQDSPSSTEFNNAAAVLLVVGLFLLPLAALITAIAGWREPRHPPRAFLFLLCAFLLLLAGVLITVEMYTDPISDKTVYPVMIVNVALPLALLFSLPGIYSAARALPEVRAILEDDINRLVLGTIQARGAVSFADLAKAVNIPLSEVYDRVDQLISSRQLAATLDAEQKWIYTASYLAEKQRNLLQWVNERGRIRLDELARLLKVSVETSTEWIYQLVEREQFDGYINWKQGLIYAATASKIGAASQCPQCGGMLSPAPGDCIVCLHCGTEAWSSVRSA
jgi:DNA-binding Lrp family transcriptional regulator